MRVLFFFLILLSCQPTTKDDFQSEGKAWMISLCEELKQIQTKEDMQKKLPILTKKFNKLADLILQVRKNKNQDWTLTENETKESKHLLDELERIYWIPGGKEMIELSQMEALQALHEGRK